MKIHGRPGRGLGLVAFAAMLSLALQTTGEAQPGDDCTSTTAIPVAAYPAKYSTTIDLSPTGGYADDFTPSVGVDGADAVWTFPGIPSLPANTYIVINTAFSNGVNGTTLALHRDGPTAGCVNASVLTRDAQTSETALLSHLANTGGTPYTLVLDSGTNALPGGTLMNLNVYFHFGGPPAGDNCTNAFSIASLPFSATNVNLEAFGDDVSDPTWPNSGANSDAVWHLPALAAGTQVTVDTLGSAFPTLLGVRNGCNGTAVDTDLFGETLPYQSTVTFMTAAGGDYYIVIEGVNGGMSLANLNVKIGQPGSPPVNDDKPLQQLGLGNVSTADFSPDERFIIAAGQGGTVLWDVASGTRLRTLPNTTSDAKFSPDGQLIAFAQGSNTIITDAETGEVIRILQNSGTPNGEQFLAFHPDASGATPWLAVGYSLEHTVEIWNYATGASVLVIGETGPNVEAHIRCMTFSPDGSELICGHSVYNPDPEVGTRVLHKDISVWNSATGSLITTFTEHNTAIASLEVRSDAGVDYLLSCSEHEAITTPSLVVLYNLNTDLAENAITPTPTDHKYAGATMPPDRSLWALDNISGPSVWIGDVGAPTPHYFIPPKTAPRSKFSPSGAYLCVVEPQGAAVTLYTVNDASATKVLALDGYTGTLQASVPVLLPTKKELWTAHTSGKGTRWSVTSGNPLQNITHTKSGSRYLAFSADASLAFYALPSAIPTNDDRLFAQRTSDGVEVREYNLGALGLFKNLTPNSISVNGPHLAVGGEGAVVVLNVITGTLVRTFNLTTIFGSGAAAQIVALSPDGQKIFFYGSGVTPAPALPGRIFGVVTGLQLGSFGNLPSGGADDLVVSAKFSPDNTQLVTGYFSGNTTLRHGVLGTYTRSYFSSGEGQSLCQTFSADGTKLLIGSGAGKVRMYETATARCLRQLAPSQVTFDNLVLSLCFLEDETRLAAGCSDGRTFIWELDPPRALFVAAGDPDPLNNALTVQTTSLTEYAADVSVRRDYMPDDMRILSSFRDAPFTIPIDYDGDTIDDTYANTTETNLRDAILTWGNEQCDYGRRLFIYMTDHGLRESGETHFILNACETISATEVDAILDEYQNPALNGGKKHEVTLVVDCCYSGEFIDACAPTGTQDRTIISSTSEEDLAVFLPAPDLTSFTEQFFGAAYMGASIKSGFDAGKSFFQSFTIANQIPELMDEEGTGAGTATGFLGKSWIYASGGGGFATLGNLGTATISPPGVLSPGTTVTLSVTVESAANPTNVFAQVLEPAPDTLSANPVTNLPLITLTQPDPVGTPELWEGTYVVTEDGTYTFGVYGRYTGARRSETEVVFASVNEVDPEESRPLVAVLVAGQDDPIAQTGEMDDQALNLTARAFMTAEDRQYATGDIRVLGPAVLASLGTNLPVDATFANFSSALSSAVSGQPGAKLFISLIGPIAPVTDDFQFQSGETLSPAQLDALLDPLQIANPDLEIILLIDCPKAGRFEAVVDQANRFLVLGTDAGGDGFYLPGPTYQAYSRRFLEASRQGRDLYDSNLSGEEFADLFSLPAPILTDGTGNAIPTLAVDKYLGRRGVFASDAGELATICNVAPDQVPVTLTEVQIYADFQEGLEPTQVTAQAVPDPPDAFVGDAPTIVMTRVSPTSQRWYVPAGQMATLFPTNGSFLVAYEASYPTSDTLPRQSQAEGNRVSLVDAGTDIYEPTPYFDSTSGTTANVLLDRQAQNHTLHTTADEDWGIVYQTYEALSYPFSLHFELNLPTNAVLRVELYDDGPAMPPTRTELILWTETTRDIAWIGSGYKEIYFRVMLDSGDVTPFLGYQVTFFQNTGANNGIATTVGSSMLQANWSTNSVPAGSQGFNVTRSSSGVAGTFVQVNSTPVPVPSTTGACPGSGCATYLDTGLSPLTVYFYQVQVVPAAGSPTTWTGAFYGYTSDGPTPTPTPSPTTSPTATFSPTPTVSPSPTPSPTPAPNTVNETWALYE